MELAWVLEDGRAVGLGLLLKREEVVAPAVAGEGELKSRWDWQLHQDADGRITLRPPDPSAQCHAKYSVNHHQLNVSYVTKGHVFDLKV